MAFSADFTYDSARVKLPSAYTNPTVAELGAGYFEVNFSHTFAASGVANADPAVAAGNVGTTIDTWVEGTLIANAVGGMCLDVTGTVVGRIVITGVKRKNDREDLTDPDWVTGTDEFTVTGKLQWERTA